MLSKVSTYLIYAVMIPFILGGVLYIAHGVSLIEDFNDFVETERNNFIKKSPSHLVAYSTLDYCRDRRLDYVGCKIEIKARFQALNIETPPNEIFADIELLDDKLKSEKTLLFTSNSSVQMASIFYAL